MKRGLLLLAVMCVAGCASPSPAVVSLEPIEASRFAPWDPDAVFQLGDYVEYEIDAQQGADVFHWRLKLMPSSNRRGRVELRRGGKVIDTPAHPVFTTVVLEEAKAPGKEPTFAGLTNILLIRQCFAHNIHTLRLALEQAAPAPGDVDLEHHSDYSNFAILALFVSLLQDELFQDVFQKAVGPPSLGMALRALWESPTFALDFGMDGSGLEPSTWQLHPDAPELPATVTVATIGIGSEVLLEMTFKAIEPISPVHVGYGIVEIFGEHPQDPNRWVKIRMVGARRSGSSSSSATTESQPPTD